MFAAIGGITAETGGIIGKVGGINLETGGITGKTDGIKPKVGGMPLVRCPPSDRGLANQAKCP